MAVYGITIEVRWEMGHRLSEGYVGPCNNIHGHSYKAQFTFEQDHLNKVGFIRDFKDIKKSITSFINARLDHVMLVSENDPMLEQLCKLEPPVTIVAWNVNPTAENIAHYLFNTFKEAKDWPPIKEVKVWETDNFCASYDNYDEE